MEKWLIRNLKWFVLIFLVLFIIKSVQSCNRKMSLKIIEKNLTMECDSIINVKDQEIKILKDEIMTRDYMIKDLTNDLKIAGIKVDEAQKTVEAVTRTAEARAKSPSITYIYTDTTKRK